MKTSIRDVRENAVNLMEEDREAEAETTVIKALQNHPEDLDLFSMLGIIQARLHRAEEAESTLRSVLERNPCHQEAACALGRILDHSLRTAEAEVLYRDALSKRPESHSVLDDLCRLLLGEDREDEALQIARNHVAQHPHSIEAYDGLRYVLAKTEDRLEGMVDATDPDSALVHELFENMSEQLDTVRAVFDNVDANTIQEDVRFDMEEDVLRLKAEIGHFRDQMIRVGFTLRSDVESRINAALQDK
ncbi:MAG: hypothetical protein ACXADO_10425 [Candidatus Thorarchaeota archaeon]